MSRVTIEGKTIFGLDFRGADKTKQETYDFLGISTVQVSNIETSLKWLEIRKKRDELISSTDWTQAADVPLTDTVKGEFLKYRQLLRDIPQKFSDPDDVVWPVKPTI